MKTIFALLAAALVAVAGAQAPVSAYRFDNDLNPYLDNNPPYVGPATHRTGSLPTQPFSPTVYAADTVGATNKNVVTYQAPQFFRVQHGMNANGGQYVNRYSMVFDVKFLDPVIGEFHSFFNTTLDQGNDGDSFVRWDDDGAGQPIGRLGISGVYAGDLRPNTWYRLVIAVDCTFDNAGANTTRITYFVDGTQVNQVLAGSGIDGRFSAYSWDDNDPDSDTIDIFGDNDGDTGSGRLSLLAFFDRELNATEVGGLGPVGSQIGGPANEEIFPTSFNRLRGRVDAGDVNSLRGDDNNRFRVCRFIVPNDPARIIEVDYLGATTIAAPTSFKLDVRSRSTVGGLVQQTLQVFNYQTNAFDTTDFNQVNLNTTLTTRTVNGTGSVARLVGTAGALRAKQTIRIVGPVPNPNVCNETTLVRWTIGG